MDGIGGQVELASLPGGSTEDGSARSAKAGMIVGNDEFDAAHAACDQAVEEAASVNLGL